MSYELRDVNTTTGLLSFEDILDEIERLSREHLLLYRVQLGRLFLRHFWDDDPVLFSSKNPQKDARLKLFFSKNEEALKRYGLSQRQAHASIRVSIVVRSLPPGLAEQLFLSQVMELARLTDPTRRAEVAQAAIERDWSVVQLRDAISAVQAGLSLEAGAMPPTVEVPKSVTQGRVPAPGRLVTRAERIVDELTTWTEHWTQTDASRLRRPQRLRLEAAMTALEARVLALRKVLGTAPTANGTQEDV